MPYNAGVLQLELHVYVRECARLVEGCVTLLVRHAVEGVFQTMCDCAALNPDDDDEGAHC